MPMAGSALLENTGENLLHTEATTRKCCIRRIRPGIELITKRRSKNICLFKMKQLLIGFGGVLLFTFLIIPAAHCQITHDFECLPNGCCDQHEWCQFWASIGECGTNLHWMTDMCQIACNSCNATGSSQGGGRPPSQNGPPSQATNQSGPPAAHVVAGPRQSLFGVLPPQINGTFAEPTGPKEKLGNNAARCNEIRKNTLNSAILFMQHLGLISDKEDISFRRTISSFDIEGSNKQFGCAPQQDFTDCGRNICYNLRYRTMDGSCNNLDNPFFGAAAIPYVHTKPPNYDDGIGAPTSSVRGGRPSARDASRFLLSSPQLVTNNRFNSLLMQFGQFVTHDITKTSVLPTDLCIGCTEIPGRCSPIRVDTFDPRFGCQQPPCCLAFTRAAPVCGSGTNSPRTQLNENTAFLDASLIYGSSVPDINRLRDGPFMKMTVFNGHPFPPFNQQQCFGPSSCNANFDAGDNRITIFVGLAAFHTVFLREHNRIVSVLQQKNPQWSADRVFHEARKIVGAEVQAITYKEWLPKILGSSFNSAIGAYKGYNAQVNPSITSEFAHAAMRFGHGMIQEFFQRIGPGGQPIAEGGMRFDEGVLKPQKLIFEGGIDPILRGLMTMPVKKPQRLTSAATERMFGSSDLASINLQRGRDVGVPSYNEWREFCGLRRAQTFDDVSDEILDVNVRNNLKQGFGSPDNVDLYVGALIEDPVADGLVGPTLVCLLGEQFRKVREGDRFWYQSPATFTPEQLTELERVTLARIICDNSDGIDMVPIDAFQLASTGSGTVSCSAVPGMDLSRWSD